MGRNRSVKWFVLVGLCVLLCSTGVLAYELMGRMKSPEDEQETTSENPAEGEASTDTKTPVTGEDFFQLGSFAVPLDGFRVVFLDTDAGKKALAQQVHRIGVSLLGSLTAVLENLGFVFLEATIKIVVRFPEAD